MVFLDFTRCAQVKQRHANPYSSSWEDQSKLKATGFACNTAVYSVHCVANQPVRIDTVKILHGNTTPPVCQYNHEIPAVIFSSSGFVGNVFHEIIEIIIPLYITTKNFQSRVLFILEDYKYIKICLVSKDCSIA
ncbi:uncharacterized protein Fot_43124 [Forsythia ovata]|uniref:Uncharacterized protein n=1 Tax=Forsythia ovata TaxID=205694 RepID=A0ABD1RPS7_9LAMI